MGIRARFVLAVSLTLAGTAAAAACGAGAGLSSTGSFRSRFSGPFHAIRASSPPIGCALAKTLARAKVRPVWFPSPQPPGRFAVNTYVPIFGPGLRWASGRRYVFLGRVPGGANLGAPFPKQVENPYLANFHRRLQVWRLANVEGGRLYAEWPTFSRYPDMTYAVANAETPSQFVAFLGSLQHVVWPRCGTG